ncbi:MAG: hypothetical protein EON95_08320 [Caulobacteraceae bacterium]|nr:MAG: hypothetical protein EON95_08320 [Caulobacteraceae bacterium]
MPRSLIPFTLAAALMAGPAFAQTQEETTGTIQAVFRGDVLAACRMSTPLAPTADNAQVGALAPGSADIAINQLVGDDGAPIGATIVLVLPATCNQAHTLNLSSLNGGLKGDGPALPGGAFRSQAPYTVTVAWAGESQTFQTQDESLSFALGSAATGPVTVTIQIPAGGAPLAAGTYSDELVLELGVAG